MKKGRLIFRHILTKVCSNFFVTLSTIIFIVLIQPSFCMGREDDFLLMEQLDCRIHELKEIKRGFEATALRAENQGQRLQFDNENYLEARRYLKMAEVYRKKAKAIQDEIDRLEKIKAAKTE